MHLRTRFAPSPTGDLHLGGARTALYGWLFARRHNGSFILRIEDTDAERSTERATQIILEGMKWLGLQWDEGPVYQSKRLDRYRSVINRLLAEGHAYRCTCSKERLEELRAQQIARFEKPKYDGRCRTLNLTEEACMGKPFVIRFANPTSGEVCFHDLIRGMLRVQNTELDDLILQRSDGLPTYNFCVVVDDMDMSISHVIRGEDHINNTFRQLNILQALGASRPQYAHVSMILDEQGNKLSKRTHATNLLDYRDQGFLPEAMKNYLLRLGWGHGDQELFSTEEMIAYFSLESVSNSSSAFDAKKLLWMNQQYLKRLPEPVIAEYLKAQMVRMGLDQQKLPDVQRLVHLLKDRVSTLKELAEAAQLYFGSEDTAAVSEEARPHLTSELIEPFQELVDWAEHAQSAWEKTVLLDYIKQLAKSYELSLAQMGMALRVAIVGKESSPGFAGILETLGRQRSINRLQHVIKWMKSNAQLD